MQNITHLLNRIGFGPRPGQIERVQEIGADRYLEQQLRPERIDDANAERLLSALPSIRMSASEITAQYQRGAKNPPQELLVELQAQKLIRAVHSERQLQEVMTGFWFNHFNIFWGKNADRWLVTTYEMHAIRPNALGRFHDLLLATANSPAMLVYLDNHLSSSIRGINENYGRELMELHTLGVNGGYTQK